MKQLIPTGTGDLSTIITKMLMDQGLTEFTVSIADFDRLNLSDYVIETTGDVVDGELLSFTATLIYRPVN